MNYETLSTQIDDLLQSNQTLMFKLEPDVADFTNSEFSGSIVLVGRSKQKKDIQVKIPFGQKDLGLLLGIFDNTIFHPDFMDRLFAWDFKVFASFCKYHLGKTPNVKIPFFDLQIIESFLGVNDPPPMTVSEFALRIQTATRMSDWGSVYKKIHKPLALEVIPRIESFPLLNTTIRDEVHPCYQIEGQQNGRLNCYKGFKLGYLPHNMGAEVRNQLKPLGEKLRFLLADYRHCEVNVLQWLCKCDVLGGIIESGGDVHERIYEIIMNDECNNEKKRNQSKLIFLPVVYGCGPSTLASRLKIPLKFGEEIHKRVKASFPTPLQWAKQQEQIAQKGSFQDYFGRVRKFAKDKAYLARNAAVQGPAATVCLEKLIQLHREMEYGELAFSIHDGYGVVCKIPEAKLNYIEVKQILESESELCKGLKMKVQIKFGSTLGDARVLGG